MAETEQNDACRELHSSGPPATATKLRDVWRRAALLFAFALCVRGLHLLAMRDSPLFQVLICDCGQYDAWARRIAGGEWIGNQVFYQTPLYPYLLAVVYYVGGHSVWAVRLLQAVFGALSCVFLARAGARFFSARVGWVAGILLAIYPPAIFFDGILQKASLDLLLMTALLWTLGVAQQAAQARWFAGIGALLGAMSLNRENAAALLPVLLAWITWLSWPEVRRVWLPRCLVFIAGLALVLVPVGLRNYYVGGAFLLTTAQMGPNFYIGNHRGADGGYSPMRAGRGEPGFEALDARMIAEDDLKRALTSREVSQYWLGRSWREIREAPVAWVRLLGRKWLLTWNALEMIDAEAIHTHALHSPVLRVLRLVLHFGVLCPLTALGIWLTRRDWRQLWILYAMLVTFAAAVTLFYVFARYRYPLVPVVTLFAAAGVVEASRRAWRGSRDDRGELLIGGVIVAAAAVACNWPIPQQYRDDAITYYNAGSTMMGLGRTPEALQLYELAIAADPKFPETYNNVGRALLEEGQTAAAKRNLEQAIALDPQHALYHLNLANVFLKERDFPRAAAELERTIELDPLLLIAYGPLAELKFNAGDVDGAVHILRRAVERQPGTAATHADLAMVLEAQGHMAEVIQELRVAVALDPGLLAAGNRLAWLLATTPDDQLRNGREAVALAERLSRAANDAQPQLLDTLAAALAETGDYLRAAEIAERAVNLARQSGEANLALAIENRLALYRQGTPYHAPPTGR